MYSNFKLSDILFYNGSILLKEKNNSLHIDNYFLFIVPYRHCQNCLNEPSQREVLQNFQKPLDLLDRIHILFILTALFK